MANNIQSHSHSKLSKPVQPYLSQQFFNWILTITVAFLLGKSCWLPEKTNLTPCNCCCNQPLGSTKNTPAVMRQDTVFSASPQAVAAPLARNYIRGPRGGCYYINENGNKVYVDRSLCN